VRGGIIPRVFPHTPIHGPHIPLHETADGLGILVAITDQDQSAPGIHPRPPYGGERTRPPQLGSSHDSRGKGSVQTGLSVPRSNSPSDARPPSAYEERSPDYLLRHISELPARQESSTRTQPPRTTNLRLFHCELSERNLTLLSTSLLLDLPPLPCTPTPQAHKYYRPNSSQVVTQGYHRERG